MSELFPLIVVGVVFVALVILWVVLTSRYKRVVAGFAAKKGWTFIERQPVQPGPVVQRGVRYGMRGDDWEYLVISMLMNQVSVHLKPNHIGFRREREWRTLWQTGEGTSQLLLLVPTMPGGMNPFDNQFIRMVMNPDEVLNMMISIMLHTEQKTDVPLHNLGTVDEADFVMYAPDHTAAGLVNENVREVLAGWSDKGHQYQRRPTVLLAPQGTFVMLGFRDANTARIERTIQFGQALRAALR